MRFFTILVILTGLQLSTMAQQIGREIMLKVDEQTNLPDEYQEMEMVQISSNGKKMNRLLKMYIERKGENRNSLIVFTSPADIEGSAFLTIENDHREDDNWLYLPILRRSRRISSTDITDKFMGSDFTYEDLQEEDLGDFSYEYLGEATVAGKAAYKVEAIAATPKKKQETGYSKRVIYVDKASSLMVKIDYYSPKGQHIKTFEAGDIRPVAGTEKFRTYAMSMTDLQKDHKTELHFSTIQINNDFRSDMFSKRTLESGI
ncbi:outer membrane lipoprotein-sorting protein [Marinoscillum furvescens]|uniref:Outer membrane lipoprotein-sorting protein n=1 Tax=Marinoscillum furvescens DSM 4134 TaxID=1122208 RepID=A0A3D9KY04_MARFU|nr:outer membrane lipoprotein-sorting protein [Marinoscillum furvescens]RED93028.1 outer membrane lipoprotein-sorting protein [Marinoscillum furvescens DSM 4134]